MAGRVDTPGSTGEDWDAVADAADAAGGGAVALAALARLHALRADLDRWEPQLIAAARAGGESWAAVADAVGVRSRQAAERRYLRMRDAPGATGADRIQATRDDRAADRAAESWARSSAGELRRVAAEVDGLDGLDRRATPPARRLARALDEDDAAALVEPLVALVPHLRRTHPEAFSRISILIARRDEARAAETRRRAP